MLPEIEHFHHAERQRDAWVHAAVLGVCCLSLAWAGLVTVDLALRWLLLGAALLESGLVAVWIARARRHARRVRELEAAGVAPRPLQIPRGKDRR